MFKLNEKIKVRGIRISKSYDMWGSNRYIIFEPFLFVSEEEEGVDEECFLTDFLGADISLNFYNQERLIEAKKQESARNLKIKGLAPYSIKKLRAFMDGAGGLKIPSNHRVESFEDEIEFYMNKKYGDIDVKFNGVG